MTELLHVVYREGPAEADELAWDSSSFPDSIYAGGDTLEDMRKRFRDAAAFRYEDEPIPPLYDHIERQAADGVFLRVAVDRHTLDRDYVRATLENGLNQPAGYRPEFSEEHLAATGDVVVICCVAADPLGWVIEQMSDHDAVHVAIAVSEFGVAYAVLAGSAAIPAPQHPQTLADLSLSATSTVGEFVMATVADRSSSTRPVLIPAA